MGWFTNTTFDTMEDLLVHQLKDLFDAENRLVEALPKMAEAAHSPDLKQAFQKHLGETKEHVRRLEQAFSILGQEASRESCPAMQGLVKEGSEMINAKGSPDVCDQALIAAAQRVEHYEMAGYGAARCIASRAGHEDVAKLLQLTLDEEGAADKKLTEIAGGTCQVA